MRDATLSAARLGGRIRKPWGRTGGRGFTMVELAATLVVIAALFVAFRGQTGSLSQARAADDLAAQARLDAVANAIHLAHRPGALLGELTAENLSTYTTAPITTGLIPLLEDGTGDRRYVSFATGDASGNEAGPGSVATGGYYGIATLGRDGSCWLVRGRIGLTGTADTGMQASYHAYVDFEDEYVTVDGEPYGGEEAAQAACTGAAALAITEGGPSWQEFVILPS